MADKLRTYDPGVVAFVADDAGALSVGALRLLRRLAAAVGSEEMGSKILLTWRAELQHTSCRRAQEWPSQLEVCPGQCETAP